MKRVVYLDALRGIAILLMVADHAYDWWLDAAGHATTLASVTGFLGTLAAPLFLYLVGVGLALSAHRSTAAGRPRRDVVRHLLLRGGQIVLWGYALNLLVFFVGDNPADIAALDVLHTIGICIWLTIPLLWLPAPAVAVLTLVTIAIGQTAGGWILPDWLAVYITGTAGIGYFPVALWLPYSYLGLATGKWIANTTRPGRMMIALSLVGLLALISTLFIDPAWGYQHPRPIFVPFAIAIVLWLTAGTWLWVDRSERLGPILRALRDMGVASLLVYFLHHLVAYRFFWALGWVTGRSWRGDYGLFSPSGATALFVLLTGLMLVAARIWIRWRGKMHST